MKVKCLRCSHFFAKPKPRCPHCATLRSAMLKPATKPPHSELTLWNPSESTLRRRFPAGHGCVIRGCYCDIVGPADAFLQPGCIRVRFRPDPAIIIVHHSKVTLAL